MIYLIIIMTKKNRKTTTIRLDKKTKIKAAKYADKKGISFASLVRLALDNFIKNFK